MEAKKVAAFVAQNFGDGHGIWPPNALDDLGFDKREVASLVRTHTSNTGHEKTTIRVGGKPVDELKGIYSLEFFRFLGRKLGVPPSDKIGRGSEAQELCDGILKVLGEKIGQ